VQIYDQHLKIVIFTFLVIMIGIAWPRLSNPIPSTTFLLMS